MRSAVIHGLLLAVMLIYGYRTWTRDKTVKQDLGSVQLWKKDDSELASIEYKNEKKTVRLERKGAGKDGYWWGTETTTEKKPKAKPPEPPKPAPAGSGSGSGSGSAAKAGSGSGSGSAVAAGSGSAKAGSGSAVAAGSGSAKAGSGSAVAAGSGSAKAGSGSGSGSNVAAGSGSGSGSATPAPPTPPVEFVETTKVREFPLGEGGDKLVKNFSDAHAISDLGKPTSEQLVDYKLANKDQVEAKLADVKKELEAVKAQEAKDKEQEDAENKDKDPKDKKKPIKKDDKKPELNKKIKELEDQKKAADKKTTIVVKFTDGSSREFLVGGSVFGGSDRYVLDQQSGSAYVLSKEMVSGLEVGESSLQLTDPKGFPVADIEGVEVEWGTRKKGAKRLEAPDASGKTVKTWTDMDTGKPNQPLATFIDNINNMRPVEYSKDVKVEGAPIYRLVYKDAKGAQLGTLSLYKIEKPPVIPEGQDFDPANPPKGEIEYYVVTERTRVPALVRADPARKSEEDLPIVFGDKAAPVAPKPGSNPFGNVPVKPVPTPGQGSNAKPAPGGLPFGSGKP